MLSKKHILEIALTVCVFYSFLIFLGSTPLDDFNRHSVSGYFNFDYQNMYGENGYPFSSNYWFAYEYLIFNLKHYLGELEGIVTLKIVFFLLAVAPFFLKNKLTEFEKALFFLLCILTSFVYFSNLRPASLASLLVIFSLIFYYSDYSIRSKKFVVGLSAILISILYHGFFGFNLLLLATFPVIVLSITVIAFLAWNYFTDFEWLSFERTLLSSSAERGFDGVFMGISELEFPMKLIIMFMFFLMIINKTGIKLNSFWFMDNLSLIFAITILLTTFDLRFYMLAAPLIAFLFLKSDNRISLDGRLIFIFFGIIYTLLPLNFKIPTDVIEGDYSNKRMFFSNMLDMHSFSKYVKSSIYIEPSMDPVFDKKYLENWSKSSFNKDNICDYLINNNFDYYGESTGVINKECMDYAETDGIIRIWKIEVSENLQGED